MSLVRVQQPAGDSSWHRWQLTALAAALSRPVRTTTQLPEVEVRHTPPIPVMLDGAPARQRDATSCGAAVLVMLAATGDPALATWLDTGRLPRGASRPAELSRELVTRGAELGAAGRFAAAQSAIKTRTSRRALGGLPWPASLGTPPWTAAREARFPGVRYRVRAVDDATADARTVLAMVLAATRRGLPVPLYAGGDLRTGLSRAVPRHVVLAVPPPPGAAEPGVLQLYEPGGGAVHRIAASALLERRTPHPALGGWSHLMIALLPVPR